MTRYPQAILILWLALLVAGCAGVEHRGAPMPLPALPADHIGLDSVDRLQLQAQFGEGLARLATFDPSGRYLAVSSTSGVYLYDTHEWKQQPFAGSGEPARKLAFSPDGRYLAVAPMDSGRLQLWELQTGRLARDWPAINSTLLMLAFSGDGKQLASVSFSAIRLYAVDSDGPPRLIAAPEGGRFLSAAFSGDLSHASTLLSGPGGDALFIWRLADSEVIERIEGAPGGWYDAGQFAPAGHRLTALHLPDSSRRSAQLFAWTPEMVAATSAELTLDAGDPAQFVTAAWAGLPESGLVAAGLTDGRALLYSADGALPATLTPPQAAAVAWLLPSADGQRLAVVYDDATVTVWDVAAAEPLSAIVLGDRGPVVHAALQPDGRRMTTVMRSGEVLILDLDAGAVEAAIDQHMLGSVRDLAFSPDGSRLASASAGGVTQLWEAATGAPLQQMPAIPAQIDGVSFSPDGSLLASGVGERVGPLAFDDSVFVRRLADAALQWRSTGGQEEIAGCTLFRNRLAFTPDGSLLAATSHDFAIQLWQAVDGAERGRLVGHSAPVMDLDIAPDGVLLASASQDGDIRLWSLPAGELVRVLSTESLGMLAVAFSPDGRYLAGGAFTGELFLWDAESGRLVRRFDGGMAAYSTLAFSPDGSLLAAGAGGSLQLWSVASGQPVRALGGNGGDVISVAFSPDGSRVAFGSEAGVIQLWGVR